MEREGGGRWKGNGLVWMGWARGENHLCGEGGMCALKGGRGAGKIILEAPSGSPPPTRGWGGWVGCVERGRGWRKMGWGR